MGKRAAISFYNEEATLATIGVTYENICERDTTIKLVSDLLDKTRSIDTYHLIYALGGSLRAYGYVVEILNPEDRGHVNIRFNRTYGTITIEDAEGNPIL